MMNLNIYEPEDNRISTYTASRKKAIYDWRETPTGHTNYCSYQKKYQRDNYERIGYTPQVKERKKKTYEWNKIKKQLLQQLCNLFEE